MLSGGRDRLVTAFIAYALVATTVLSVLLPPFQNADEVNHFLRADNLSRLHLFGERYAGGRSSGGIAAPGIEASAAPFEALKFHPEVKATIARYAAAAAAHWREPARPALFANTAIYPP
ncbi:MAG TPA: hypothetical protein VE650_00030, partial [Acetobacteraceae bacterium]|nr:hypothetical protein [Acetobacteraceae bacterium]